MAKRLEIGAVIGASPKENVVRDVPAPDDVIVLLGGRTGRDGCGGATGSSKAHTMDSIETCGAEVQKGNPPTERKIQRLFRNKTVSTMIKRCNDFGAGGVCVAIGELADGLTVDLDKVTKKYDGLDGTELAISESQERMAVVLDPADVDKFIAEADKENLEATAVAVVTENPRLTMQWRGKVIVDLSREFLNTNGVTQVADAYITAPDPNQCYRRLAPEILRDKNAAEAFKANLSRLEVCSQKGLCERFDASIGASTVLMPFGGVTQLTPEEAMAAKIPLLEGETDDATAMSYGYIPGVSRWSPFHGSAYAVVESLSKLLAIGANPLTPRLTFQEYFERLHDVPQRWGKPAAALLGSLVAQIKLGLPSIGGKDSMSGSFENLDVPPTLVSFAVAMTKASKTISAEFKKSGSKVIYIPVPEEKETLLPDWEKLKTMYQTVYELIHNGKVLAASVVREGGAAAAVARMSFGNRIGFKFAKELTNDELFAPLSGSLVVELADGVQLDSSVLFYELGTHSFHTPIEEFEIPENLDVIDIDELDTYGDGIENLLSNVFVTKVMLMIYSGDYELTFTDGIKEKKPVWDKCPDFLVKAEAKKTEKKEKTVFQAPETEITTILTWEKKEVEAIEYIVSEINSKHGPSKEDVIALARQKGMKTSAKTKKCEATEYLRGLGLLESYATQCRIGVTKFDFLRAGMRDSEYKYLTSKKRLRPISQYESESGRHKHMVNIYSIGQYLKWRNTGAVV